MSYLGLNLDSLVWELEALIKNNYGGYSYKDREVLFENAKKDILADFERIIDENKEEVFDELKKGEDENE